MTLREANAFVERHHRHSVPPRGMKFAIGAAGACSMTDVERDTDRLGRPPPRGRSVSRWAADPQIIVRDALSELRKMEAESVQTAITSPPYYGLRDYGIEGQVWDGAVECKHEWGEAISENATNHTDKRRWQHTRNGRDEEQPTEKRVAWLRTEVKQGSYCQLCGAWIGSLGLEPTPDLYVQHLVQVFREVKRVLRDDGTLWLNIGDSYNNRAKTRETSHQPALNSFTDDNWAERAARGGCRMTLTDDGLKEKDLLGIPWMLAFALRADGWYLRSEIIWAKPNPMPESVTDRPTKAHEQVFLLSKSARYYYDAEAIRESDLGTDHPRSVHDEASLEPSNGLAGPHTGIRTEQGRNGAGRNKRSVWTIATQPYPEAHFATFPPKLVEPMVLAGAPFGATVLDPFAGSGTTLEVAIGLGRSAIGIELSEDYAELAKRRLAGVTPAMFA